jgi:hypothetical protein
LRIDGRRGRTYGVGTHPGVHRRDPGIAFAQWVLAAENRILKAQLQGRLRLSDAERATLGEIGHRLGRKALGEVATAFLPDTILGWYRTLIARKFEGLPLFVTIADGELMSRVGCRRPMLAQSPPRICLRVDFFAIRHRCFTSSARVGHNAGMAPAHDFKLALTRVIEPTKGPGAELATLVDSARFV